MTEAARGTRRPATVSKSSSSASTMRQEPWTTSRRTGRSARPSMTIWSNPARLSMLGKRPPALEWVTSPKTGLWPGIQGAASGERAIVPTNEQEPRPAVATAVSLRAAEPMTILFPGESGSVTGPVFSR